MVQGLQHKKIYPVAVNFRGGILTIRGGKFSVHVQITVGLSICLYLVNYLKNSGSLKL